MTKKRYFHIQNLDGTNTLWQKGDHINIQGPQFNSFYNDLIQSTGKNLKHNGKEIDLFQYAKFKEKEIREMPLLSYDKASCEDFLKECKAKSNTYSELASEMKETLRQYLKWIREEIFENIRKEKYHELPSRKTCLWLCEEKEIKKWYNILYPNSSKKIIEIDFKPDQKIHYANGSLITEETLNIYEFTKSAEEYWEGLLNKNCEIEILFEGKFEVINEFKKPEDI